ncbi:lipopolysaccharide biosynthesis protein [Geodermatophilus sp. URMC 61]|uniref:lipopolysaccharide biosynthesis protein n=1 Tax=Geodermatophilus sp. URMC 61 TaxID=3423411 RepID=UPI00406D4AFC
MVTNAVSAASATVATSALGLAYWFVAARSFSPSAVGFSSAAVSGMTLVSTLSSLGLTTYVLGEAQRIRERRRSLIVTTLMATGFTTTVLAVIYAVVVPLLSQDLRPLAASTWTVLLFVVGATATAVGGVLDAALLGALYGRIQLHRNTLFGVLKLLLLVLAGIVLANSGGLILFATWVAGAVLSLVWLAIARGRWTQACLSELRLSAIVPLLRDVMPPVLRHQLLNLGLKVPLLTLPVLVISVVSAEANANFYIAWQLTSTAFVLPASLAGMLYAVGADDSRALAQRLRLTLTISVVLTLIAAGVLSGGAPWILSVFGEQYVRNGTGALIVLALAGIPTVVKNHYVAVCRIGRRVHNAVPLIYLGAALEMGMAFLGGRHAGLLGFASGWLIALTLESCLMLPLVVRGLRGTVQMAIPRARPE